MDDDDSFEAGSAGFGECENNDDNIGEDKAISESNSDAACSSDEDEVINNTEGDEKAMMTQPCGAKEITNLIHENEDLKAKIKDLRASNIVMTNKVEGLTAELVKRDETIVDLENKYKVVKKERKEWHDRFQQLKEKMRNSSNGDTDVSLNSNKKERKKSASNDVGIYRRVFAEEGIWSFTTFLAQRGIFNVSDGEVIILYIVLLTLKLERLYVHSLI